MSKAIIRFKEAQKRSGFSRGHIYNLIESGEFPRPVKLSHRAVGFVEEEFEAWLDAKILARDNKAA